MSVDIHQLPLLRPYEVHRPYGIVERQRREVGRSRSPLVAEIIYLHPGIKAATVAVGEADALHLGKIPGNIGHPHVAGRFDGHRRVRREAVVGEAAFHRLTGESLHLGAPVAEFRMGMKSVEFTCTYLFKKIHISVET